MLISMEFREESSDSERGGPATVRSPLVTPLLGMSGLEIGDPVVGDDPLPVLPVPTDPRPESDLLAVMPLLPPELLEEFEKVLFGSNLEEESFEEEPCKVLELEDSPWFDDRLELELLLLTIFGVPALDRLSVDPT